MSIREFGLLEKAVALTLFVTCMGAAFLYSHDKQITAVISYTSIALVAFFSRHDRHIWPLLVLVIGIKLIQLPVSYFLRNVEIALAYYLCSALIDVLMAFFIVHYHHDEGLLRFTKAKTFGAVPQVYLMALILGLSALTSCLLAVEFIFFYFDPSFFEDSDPLVYTYQNYIKQTLKFLFEVCIWSLLLDPNRWKILQKIQNKFLAP